MHGIRAGVRKKTSKVPYIISYGRTCVVAIISNIVNSCKGKSGSEGRVQPTDFLGKQQSPWRRELLKNGVGRGRGC